MSENADSSRTNTGAGTRRRLIGYLGATTASALWSRPLVESVLLPAHAATSLAVAASCSRVERYRDEVVLQDADWQQAMFIPQYDDPSVPLLRVEVRWEVTVVGEVGLENIEDPGGGDPGELSEIGARVGASVMLTGPNSLAIGQVTPEERRTREVTGFDGAVDFGGESGVSFESISVAQTETVVYDDPETLALFTGSGGVEFAASSSASSRTFGSANLVARIETRSGLRLRVTYACA